MHLKPTSSAKKKERGIQTPARRPSKAELSRWQRELRGRRIVLVTAIILALLIVAIPAYGYWREVVRPWEDVAAIVHGEPITMRELVPTVRKGLIIVDQQIARMEMEAANFGAESPSSRLTPQNQLESMRSYRNTLPEQVLNDLVDQKLIAREALRRGIVVTDADVQKWLDEDVARQEALIEAARSQPTPTPHELPSTGTGPSEGAPAPPPTPQPTPTPTSVPPGPTATPTPPPTLTSERAAKAYAEYLQRYNYTDEEFRPLVRSTILRTKVQEAFEAEVPRSGEQVHVLRIQVAEEEKARQILERLKAGEDFSEIARAESIDGTTKDKGGDMGWVAKGLQAAALDAAAFSLQPGETSDVVRGIVGFEIIRVLERQENRPFDSQMLETIKARGFQKWVADSEASPEVKRFLDPQKKQWVLLQAKGTDGNQIPR